MSRNRQKWRLSSKLVKKAKRKLFTVGKRCCCFCDSRLAFDEATIEHIIPVSKCSSRKQAWDMDNLNIACFSCNNRRGDKEVVMVT